MLRWLAAMCLIPSAALAADPLPRFAQNVTIHVVAHEIAHALVREFDLPVLGNEEDMADTFATLFVLEVYPDRAAEIVRDRALSLRLEAWDDPADDQAMMTDHAPDLRRAYRAVCLIYGTDPARHTALADGWGLIMRPGCLDPLQGQRVFPGWA